jgi:DNA ligase (NAD+)
MDIEGLGEKIVALLLENHLIEDYGDLYQLTRDRVANLERMGAKSAENLIMAIEKSKQQSLARIIFALGIPFVGEGAARLLAQHFHSIDTLMKSSQEDIDAIEGIGETTAQSIINFFSNPANQQVLDKLKKAGVPFTEQSAVSGESGGKFEGKNFVFTGALEKYSRDEAGDRVRQHGGKVSGSVSQSTDYVVAGADPGSKYQKAKKLGIKILSEAEFIRMLEE